jgi:glycosyltransferase involved in cell wall biosynthesis
MKGAKPRVCFVVATEITVTAFLLDQIRTAAKTHDVCVALNTRNNAFLAPYEINVEVVPVAIERKIKPLADLAALFALYRLFCARRFDLIHSVSPKAGLLAMLAGFLAGVPRRLHVFTGQVWVTRRGLSRFFLKSLDRLLAALATHLLADSPSQRDFLVAEGVVTATKCTVLGKGSISGVNTARFQPDAAARDMVRLELAVPADGVLFLYLGRLNRDKGIADLAAAFANLCRSRDDIWLALVGPDEENMATLARQLCGAHADHLRLVDYTNTPQRYMAAADVFCLPSYREGFGTVVIEAAACGVAAIASRIYGLTDAVIDAETGLLHAAGDVAAIETMMARLAGDRALRQRLGAAARNRACADFAMPVLTSALLVFYAKMLN